MRIRDLLGSISIRLDEALGKLIGQAGDIAVVAGAVERLSGKIEAIQPATVDLTQEMADDIVRKIHGPLTISKHFSDWIKSEAPNRDVFWTTPLGYGRLAGQLYVILKTNGTLHLEMKSHTGEQLWMGTFAPPDFGKAAP